MEGQGCGLKSPYGLGSSANRMNNELLRSGGFMKVGDLVVVVRGCPLCGSTGDMGLPFKVEKIGSMVTSCCDGELEGAGPFEWGIPKSMLRVIPPLNELEAEKAVEHA